jgi:membrane fusion protein, heavy metal efflux system
MQFLPAKNRLLVVILSLVVVLGGGYAVVAYSRYLRVPPAQTTRAYSPAGPAADPNAIELSARTVELARIKTAEVVVSDRPRQLELRGSLAIDPNRLVHVHARFPGQIVELATSDATAGEGTGRKQLGFMDHVTKGQDLAVLWSKDLGEKKSELVDALARLRLDRQRLEALQELGKRGATTANAIREAERQVEVGEIAATRADRTLHSWMLTDAEIDIIRAEADRIYKHDERNKEAETNWARLDMVAPIDGTIVEKNVTIGDIVDTTLDLFKIADLSRLNVWLHAYEEDLPYLEKLPRPIRARISLPSSPEAGELDAKIDRIGEIIDPFEHMALLIGSVDNPKGELRAGQFVTGKVQIPPEEGVVEIPAKSLIDDGNQAFVFVQPDPKVFRYVRRRVAASRRYFDVVYVRSELSEQQREIGIQALQPGERVVSSGGAQLEEMLQSRQVPEAAH